MCVVSYDAWVGDLQLEDDPPSPQQGPWEVRFNRERFEFKFLRSFLSGHETQQRWSTVIIFNVIIVITFDACNKML